MDTSFRMMGGRVIKLKEEDNGKGDNNKPVVEEEAPSTSTIVPPKAKPVTASLQDVLACYSQIMVQNGGEEDIPPLEDGVTEFEYEGSEVTAYSKGGLLNIQIRGKADPLIIRNRIPITFNPSTDGSDGVINGEIDEKVTQGGTGDCWVLTGVLSLNSSETGKQIIKQSIQANPDGSVTVNFKGLGVSYTISADEISKHDTDNIKGDAYSNGDNDMLVLELATEKLMADIASGKVKLDVPEDSVEAIYNEDGSIEGGFAQNMIYYLTGQTADFLYAYGQEEQGLPQNEVIQFLQEAYQTGNTAMTFGVYGAPHEATLVDGTPYKLDIQGGHALAITNLTATTVTFVNPWNSTKEYTMTWEEFAKLGIGMLTSTDLSGLGDTTPVEPGPNPVEPEPEPTPVDPEPVPPTPVEPKIYSANDYYFKKLPQSVIDEYFTPSSYNADGSVREYALKSPYTDCEIIPGKMLGIGVFEDGSTLKTDLVLSLTTVDENGKTVKTSKAFYKASDLDTFMGGTWWRGLGGCAKEYFDYDEETGYYSLKEGKSLKDFKAEIAPEMKRIDYDYASPNSWQLAVERGTNRIIYPAGPVTTYLSEGIINTFFTPEINDEGKTWGYALKEPFTGFKLVSNTDTHKTYAFSYTKDGVKYTSTVVIDESDGSYKITESSETVSTNSDADKAKILLDLMRNRHNK